MIKAPFNFVPLSDKVFFPPWANQVNHDIPFSDGESGVIDVTVTAKSPIFIRDGKHREEFCHFVNENGEKQYYIPGSSFKGMIRNVLEIMSFGKIPIDNKLHKKIMSIRDMTNRKELVGTASGCGFLKQDDNGKWIIVDYGKPRTIEYDNKNNKTINNNGDIIDCDFETAREKYIKNGLYKRVSVNNSMKDLYRNDKKIGTKRVAQIVSNEENAYIVLTGGIDNKKNEFIFYDNDKKEDSLKDIDEVVDKFKKVYWESDSIDGEFWKNNWNKKIGIPVFYVKKNNKITDIGLSQLFKLAYNYSINEATTQNIEMMTISRKKYDKLDLAETIFGTILKSKDEKSNYMLKGRVMFSHLKANTIPGEYGEVYTVLGTPRVSFYPEYIQQNCKDGKVVNDKYVTLMDKASKIAGWKRYPLRFGKPKFIIATEDTESATKFRPLGRYIQNDFNEFTFTGKIRFHNLRKLELGALVSALSFHDNQDVFYHNIGMGKSLGFGKIKLDIDTKKYQEELIEYEMIMNSWIKEKLQKKWIDTEQIKELFVMAYKNLNIDDNLKYLKLDPDNKINDFIDAKNEKIKKKYVGRDCLPKCSDMFDIGDDYPKSLLTLEFLEKAQRKDIEKKEKEIFNLKLNEVLSTTNLQVIQNFIEKNPNYKGIQEVIDKKNELELLREKEKSNKHQEINKKFNQALDKLDKTKSKKVAKFLKKWNKKQENKGSEYILNKLKELS